VKLFRRLSLLGVFFPLLASAEFRKITLSFGGLDCASCAEFIQTKLSRMRGIESAAVDRRAGTVIVTLHADNRVRLEQVRDFVQQSGFTPGEATVEVRGALVKADSGWTLRIPETGATYQLSLPEGFKPEDGAVLTVSGTVPPPQKSGSPEILKVRQA
jgi:copper chaperone CopZ